MPEKRNSPLFPKQKWNELPSPDPDSQTSILNAVALVRFYDQSSDWQWYGIEFDQADVFWGIVTNGKLALAGNFSLSELEGIESEETRRKTVRIDEDFKPLKVSELAQSDPAVMELMRDLESRMRSIPSDLVELD
jgi:hypothetical protein